MEKLAKVRKKFDNITLCDNHGGELVISGGATNSIMDEGLVIKGEMRVECLLDIAAIHNALKEGFLGTVIR